MRTSRLSKDTSRLISATKASKSPKRITRSSLARFANNGSSVGKEEEGESKTKLQDATDIEDAVPEPRKRKRTVSETPVKNSSQRQVKVKTEVDESKTVLPSPSNERKARKPARQVKNEDTGEVEIHPPTDWEKVYSIVKEMRLNGSASNAAVDTMGCEALAEEQTKDTVTALAIKRLQAELPPHAAGAPPGLNVENILAVEPAKLNELIYAVGFHNNKTKYIKATALILRDKFNSDIPDTIEGMTSLPGVGPKMAYLCMSTAWGRDEGIGVDVHVHRITNLWGWHGGGGTKGPEETRIALQKWLPRELWHEINWLLVGFGQTICLPVGRKCGECELGLQGLCKSAERGKVIAGRRLKEEILVKNEDGEVVEKKAIVKEEVKEEAKPVNAAPYVGVDVAGQEEVMDNTDIAKSEKIMKQETLDEKKVEAATFIEEVMDNTDIAKSEKTLKQETLDEKKVRAATFKEEVMDNTDIAKGEKILKQEALDEKKVEAATFKEEPMPADRMKGRGVKNETEQEGKPLNTASHARVKAGSQPRIVKQEDAAKVEEDVE